MGEGEVGEERGGERERVCVSESELLLLVYFIHTHSTESVAIKIIG